MKEIPLWMPGSGFKRQAFFIKTLIRKTLDTPFSMVQRALVSGPTHEHVKLCMEADSPQGEGIAAPSFTATLLEEASVEGKLTTDHEEDIKGAAGVIYAGTSFRVSPPRTQTYWLFQRALIR